MLPVPKTWISPRPLTCDLKLWISQLLQKMLKKKLFWLDWVKQESPFADPATTTLTTLNVKVDLLTSRGVWNPYFGRLFASLHQPMRCQRHSVRLRQTCDNLQDAKSMLSILTMFLYLTQSNWIYLFVYLLVWMFRRAGHCWMILSKLVEINYHRCFSFSQENNCPFPRSFRCSQHRELWLMSPEPNLKCHHQNYTKGQAIAGQGLLL